MEQKASILIVDDDESNCKTLSLIFEKKGYETDTAGTGQEAMAKAQGRFFNAVLLDIKLPDMEGVELLAPLKEMHPDMVLLMVTAYAALETAMRALNEGASAYISKPLNMDEVMATVQEALEKQHLVMENRRLLEDLRRELGERKRTEKALERTNQDLKHTLEELRKANQKILEQQKSVIEEERLKALLQMAGATAHELNQPLTALLGNIDLMRRDGGKPEDLARRIAVVGQAGERIADIVSKIQNIRQYDTGPYLESMRIINLNQKVNVLLVEDSDQDFETIRAVLKDIGRIALTRARGIAEALQVLEHGQIDLILLDYLLPDGNGLDFLRIMHHKDMETPVIVTTGKGDEIIASQVIKAGAYDYFPKAVVNESGLSRSITNALEKACLKREVKQTQRKLAEM